MTSLLLRHVAPQILAAGIGEALVEVEDVSRVAEVDAAHLVGARSRRRLVVALVVGEDVWRLLVLVAMW